MREFERKFNEVAVKKYKRQYSPPASVNLTARVLPCNSLAPLDESTKFDFDEKKKEFDAASKRQAELFAVNS